MSLGGRSLTVVLRRGRPSSSTFCQSPFFSTPLQNDSPPLWTTLLTFSLDSHGPLWSEVRHLPLDIPVRDDPYADGRGTHYCGRWSPQSPGSCRGLCLRRSPYHSSYRSLYERVSVTSHDGRAGACHYRVTLTGRTHRPIPGTGDWTGLVWGEFEAGRWYTVGPRKQCLWWTSKTVSLDGSN